MTWKRGAEAASKREPSSIRANGSASGVKPARLTLMVPVRVAVVAVSVLGTLSVAVSCLVPPPALAPPPRVREPVPVTPYAFEVPPALAKSTLLLEAEAGSTTGSIPEFSTQLYTAGAEASGRRYVSLAPGQSVTWRAPRSADSVVVRYSYPDSADGRGKDGALELRVSALPTQRLPVTSRFSWAYGKPAWGSNDVWASEPRRGSPRHFWDESALKLPRAFAAGATLTLLNPASSEQTLSVDFIELETVPPELTAPQGSLSFADYQPAADGVGDDTAKLEHALADAAQQKRVLYVPAGTYHIASAQMNEGTLQGAGMWRTRFVGPTAQLRFGGEPVRVADIAIFGGTTQRDDKSDVGNAFTGRPGDGSTLERIWVEHMKCAFWVAKAGEERGPTRLRISGCRFRDLMADAVNFCNGTTDSMVDNTEVRNSGDDSLAAWSPEHGGPAGGHNTFAHDFIQSPWVASGIALYGGGPFRVIGNTVQDTVTTGSGIYVSANFGAHPFTGAVEVTDNVLTRCGAHESDPGGPTGAIRVLASDLDMDAEFLFRHDTVREPLESAVSLQGPRRMTGVRFEDLVLEGVPLIADVRPGARGDATFGRVTVQGEARYRNASQFLFALTHE